MINQKDLESSSRATAAPTEEIGRMSNRTASELKNGVMEAVIKVSLREPKRVDSVYTFGTMENHTLETGKTVK